jgi:hypothetical protein
VSQTNFNRGTPRKLVWVEEGRFLGFACSECSWRFDSKFNSNLSSSPHCK